MKVSVFVGIICAMQMCGVIAQGDMAMRINAEDVKVMRQTSTVLSCIGPEPDLTYYIEHMTIWTFRPFSASRPEVTLTAGFYADAPYKDMFGTGKKYDIKFMPNEAGTNYLFNLHINNIEDTDEGIYTCYSSFKGQKVAGSEDSVQLRVLNGVERVQLDILQKESQTVELQSMTEMTAGQTSKLPAGSYDILCKASGSNPGPQMMFAKDGVENNNFKLITNIDSTGDSARYQSYFLLSNIEFAPGSSKVECSAMVPDTTFPQAKASLNLDVTIDKPEFSCNNASAVLGERYNIMICNLTSLDGSSHLTCDNVKWTVGSETNLDIRANERKSTNSYDIMEATCKKIAGGIQTELKLYQVKQAHFESGYYVVYDSGSGAHQHLVELTQLVGAASILQPSSLLLSLLIALVSKVASKHL